MPQIGIDFGTSFCSASWINPVTGRAESIRFSGELKIPSIVYYPPGESTPIVGKAAYAVFDNCRQLDSCEEIDAVMEGMFTGLKRTMRQGLKHYLPNGTKMRHEALIAELFRYIRHEAEELCFEGNKVTKVVITHPVEFEVFKKDMLREAACMAGFTQVDLLMEPIAAAMGYMNSRKMDSRNVLVYDFGAGTFDVAFVQFDDRGECRVAPSPIGDPNCGGDDIDRLLYSRWEQLAHEKYGRGIAAEEGRIDVSFEKMECTKQKELMSVRSGGFKYRVILPPPGFCRLEMNLSPEEWETLIASVVDRSIEKTRQMVERIAQAGFSIDQAIMIGGSSQIPQIAQKLKAILPVEPQRVMDLDVAVAHGAALFGAGIKIKPEATAPEPPQPPKPQPIEEEVLPYEPAPDVMLRACCDPHHQRFGYLDADGTLVIPYKYNKARDFSDGLGLVALEGKCGFIDPKDEVVIDLKYEDAYPFSEGLALIRYNGKYGYIDTTGKEVVACRYDGAYSFSDGMARVESGDRKGFINRKGQVLFSCGMDRVLSFAGGRALMQHKGKWGYIDKMGKAVILCRYQDAYGFSEGLAWVRSLDKWGAIDPDGTVVIPFGFDDVHSFSDGVAPVKFGGRWGIIDKTGNVVAPNKYDGARAFSEGLALIRREGKWGYIDSKGDEVISCHFERADSFCKGLARVERDGKIAYINKTGRIVMVSS